MTPKEIKLLIKNNMSLICKYCKSITYVGSGVIKSNNNKKLSSDFDIIIILKDIKAIFFIESFFKKIFKNKVTIVQGWGLVSFEKIGNPVIHLLIDTEETLKKRNKLLLNSIYKYKSVCGKNLSEIIKYVTITPEILLYDGDGLLRHYFDLRRKRFYICKWILFENNYVCKQFINTYSSLMDQIIYISLQAMRNYLRFLGYNIDFKSNQENLLIWKIKNLECSEFLKKIICIKEKRKINSKSSFNLEEIYSKSLMFLEYLIYNCSQSSRLPRQY